MKTIRSARLYNLTNSDQVGMQQAAMAQQDPRQVNAFVRNSIIQNAVEMTNIIYNNTLTGTLAGQTINIPVRPVGLVKRFIVEINGTFAQGAAEVQNLTKFGLANCLSAVTFTDLNNQQRINTSGWHLHFLGTARHQRAFGAAVPNDGPCAIGSNLNVISAPPSVTLAKTFRMQYEIPLAYSDYDYRGAIYAGTVNAVMNLGLTLNPNFSIASTGDETLAVYKSATAQIGVLSAVSITVYQVYMDQLPVTKNGPALPALDLSQAYTLNNTALTGMTVGQDFPVNFANQRNFQSAFLVYDNVGLNPGTDINTLALQAANYTNLFKYSPQYNGLLTRNLIRDDFPPGCYYFDFRKKPINTIQYGNMQLLMNPSAVTSSASQVLAGFEAMAQVNVLVQASSLPAG